MLSECDPSDWLNLKPFVVFWTRTNLLQPKPKNTCTFANLNRWHVLFPQIYKNPKPIPNRKQSDDATPTSQIPLHEISNTQTHLTSQRKWIRQNPNPYRTHDPLNTNLKTKRSSIEIFRFRKVQIQLNWNCSFLVQFSSCAHLSTSSMEIETWKWKNI